MQNSQECFPFIPNSIHTGCEQNKVRFNVYLIQSDAKRQQFYINWDAATRTFKTQTLRFITVYHPPHLPSFSILIRVTKTPSNSLTSSLFLSLLDPFRNNQRNFNFNISNEISIPDLNNNNNNNNSHEQPHWPQTNVIDAKVALDLHKNIIENRDYPNKINNNNISSDIAFNNNNIEKELSSILSSKIELQFLDSWEIRSVDLINQNVGDYKINNINNNNNNIDINNSNNNNNNIKEENINNKLNINDHDNKNSEINNNNYFQQNILLEREQGEFRDIYLRPRYFKKTPRPFFKVDLIINNSFEFTLVQNTKIYHPNSPNRKNFRTFVSAYPNKYEFTYDLSTNNCDVQISDLTQSEISSPVIFPYTYNNNNNNNN